MQFKYFPSTFQSLDDFLLHKMLVLDEVLSNIVGFFFFPF